MNTRRFLEMGVFLSVFSIPIGKATAQRATEEQMADQALMAVARSSREERLEAIRAAAHRHLDDVASGPQRFSPIYATIVFAAGLSPRETQDFAEAYSLEVVSAEAKFPMGEDGQVMTVSADVQFFEGSLEERLRMGTGAVQAQIMRSVQELESPMREGFLEAAHSVEPLYFRIDAIGLPRAMRSATNDETVAGIFIDSTGKKLAAARAQQGRFIQMDRYQTPLVLRRLEDGPPSGVSPDRIIPIPQP